MSLSMVKGPTFTVPSGSANSNAMLLGQSFADSDVDALKSPATLPETANLQLSFDYDPAAAASATWIDADSTNAPVGTAGLAKYIQTTYLCAIAVRVHLNGNAAADRAFTTVKRMVI